MKWCYGTPFVKADMLRQTNLRNQWQTRQERPCNSLMLLYDARDSKGDIFQVRCLSEANLRGSKGGPDKHPRTRDKFQSEGLISRDRHDLPKLRNIPRHHGTSNQIHPHQRKHTIQGWLIALHWRNRQAKDPTKKRKVLGYPRDTPCRDRYPIDRTNQGTWTTWIGTRQQQNAWGPQLRLTLPP